MKRVLIWGFSNNRAGTEAVIYNYSSRIHNVAFDFLCYDKPVNYGSLFEDGANRYFVIPVKIKHPLSYTRALKRFMAKHAHEYDALWAHLNDISNIDVLKAAKRHGVKRIIAHAHNSNIPDFWITRLFTALNQSAFDKLPTDRWACSKAAGDFFYGDRPFKILPNMVDVDNISFSKKKRANIRSHLGLEDSFAIGTVGRLAPQKNPLFLVNIMPEVLKIRPDAKLVFVGKGELKEELERRVLELGLDNKVIFAGMQSDMQGYLSAFDVFAFPSLYEGLPVSMLEAQFNGLPCIISTGISSEASISRNVKAIDLAKESAWANEIARAERVDNVLIDEKARTFDIKNGSKVLESLLLD